MPVPEVTLFKEYDMLADQRPIMRKLNDLILALDKAGIIKAVIPAKAKNIPDAMGVGKNNIESGV